MIDFLNPRVFIEWLKTFKRKEEIMIRGQLYIWDGMNKPARFSHPCGLTDNPVFFWDDKAIGEASWTMEQLQKLNIRKFND